MALGVQSHYNHGDMVRVNGIMVDVPLKPTADQIKRCALVAMGKPLPTTLWQLAGIHPDTGQHRIVGGFDKPWEWDYALTPIDDAA